MLIFESMSPTDALPRAMLVLSPDCTRLTLYAGPEQANFLAQFDLGAFRLFRPDHDSQFTSESGRTWRPVR